MRDYIELVKALMCCVDGSCEGCPRLQTPEGEFDCKNKLKTDAADAIDELVAERDQFRGQAKMVPKWISVEERLPDVNDRVLACVNILGEPSVWDAVRWNGEEWEVEEEAVYEYWTSIDHPVTHWMPLPEPPKEVLPNGDV